jgi:hypothetical protein
MTMYDYLASLWRTVVPLIVGTLVAWLAHAGIGVDSAAATAWLGTAFSAVYYAAFRLAEAHLGGAWGWFLGLARPPHYADAHGAITITGTSTGPGALPVAPPATGTPGTTPGA